MEKMISKTKADLWLLSVTVFWGSTFIISKLVLVEVPLLVFLFLRLSLAALILDLIALKFIKQLNKKTLLHGTVIGVFLYLSYFFQMWGIQYTSASNAGFVTGLSVLLVPIFGYFLYKLKPAANVTIGIILAFIGLFLLTGIDPAKWNQGDLLVFICAITVAFHIIFTGRYAPQNNVYLLTAVQLNVVAVLALIPLLFINDPWPSIELPFALSIVYLAIFGTVYTYLVQTGMQRFTTTARTALIFSMEPVFAALFAFLIANESLSVRGWIGGLLIVLGMIAAEVPSFNNYIKKFTHKLNN